MTVKKLLVTAVSITLLAAPAAFAGSITFTGSNPGAGDGPVSAQGTFVTGAGTLDITLSNLIQNQTSPGQSLSDLTFSLVNGTTTGGLLASSSGREVTVNPANDTGTEGAVVSTGWSLTLNNTTQFYLTALVGGQPQHMIIGPGNGGVYSGAVFTNANTGVGNFNPYLENGTTFHITDANITAATSITGVTFSFGTAPNEFTAPGVPSPDSGATVALLGVAMMGLAAFRAKFRKI